MKTKHLVLNSTIFLVASALIFTGCRKEKDKDDDTSGAIDNSLAEGTFNDIHQIANEASKGSVISYKNEYAGGILSNCASVVIDTANSAITVDFGTTNCLCKDNRYRRGKLYITYTPGKNYWDSAAVITIKTAPTDNYYVNDHHITGTKVITNKGRNNKGNLNWDINVSGKIVKPNGGIILWNSTRNREWTKGDATQTWIDDEYSITGSANGTSVAGHNFTVQIDPAAPLIKKMNCYWLVSGKFSFDPGNGKPMRYVDYSPKSNGGCDNWISITINGNTYYRQI